MRKNLMVAAALVFVITACLPGQDPAELEAQIQTAIVQTKQIDEQVARNVEGTLTALAPVLSPTPAVTDTPIPTATLESVIIDTDTPIPLPVFPSDTPAPARTQPPYSCYISTIKPKSGQHVGPGDSFEIVWIVVNTGTQTWRAGVDVKYAGGVKLTAASRVEIPVEMKPGDEYKIVLTGTAPTDKGLAYMSWKVDGPICYGQVTVEVK
ncbi:MAG: hypothetical protein IPG44_11340 [Anaerolineales bacterium]|jgi:hypothetical protein|nr:hypothetical protein [Chloroflexota bacterium]MBK6646318.1 hypothetical protein [Anaerolineales bacterium]MCC6986263.1 hypothetical protein [Anaerolineales bacterium]